MHFQPISHNSTKYFTARFKWIRFMLVDNELIRKVDYVCWKIKEDGHGWAVDRGRRVGSTEKGGVRFRESIQERTESCRWTAKFQLFHDLWLWFSFKGNQNVKKLNKRAFRFPIESDIGSVSTFSDRSDRCYWVLPKLSGWPRCRPQLP